MKVNVTENRLSGGYASGNTKLNVHQYLLAHMSSMATTSALQSVSREQPTNNSHTFNNYIHSRVCYQTRISETAQDPVYRPPPNFGGCGPGAHPDGLPTFCGCAPTRSLARHLTSASRIASETAGGPDG